MTFAYDANGRLQTVGTPFSGVGSTTYAYDDAERQTSRTDPAGVVTTRHYNQMGKADSETIVKGSTLASFANTFDPVGNVTQTAQTVPNPNTDGGTWTYTYDDQNRLLTAAKDGTTTTYAYDGAGNRTSVKVGTGTPVTTSYDGGSLPISSSDGTAYAFDQAGDLTQVAGNPNAGRNWAYTYDSWSRMTQAVGNVGTVTYVSDALDRQITRTRGTSTSYSYSGTGEDLAKTVAGATTTLYEQGPGGPIAQSVASVVKVYEQSLHGDLAVIANSSGSATGTQTYNPYGDKRQGTGDTSVFSFQSDPMDPDTGLVDMGTRWYDPNLGRFTSRDALFGDALSPMSLNQYVYGADNPVSMFDPDGLCYRDPDNQYGCGYTKTTQGGRHRFDFTYGKVHWWAWRRTTTTRGWDASPPPPPRPPVMLNEVSAAKIQAFAGRTHRLAELNDYQTATKAELDAAVKQVKPKEGGCGFLAMSCIGRGLWESRWQIAAGAFMVGCAAASAGILTMACGAGAVGVLVAGKEIEVAGHEALAPDGPKLSRFMKNTAFNVATAAMTRLPGGVGERLGFACVATAWCSGPYWDDPLDDTD